MAKQKPRSSSVKKKNKVASEMKAKAELAKKLEQATFDGVRYGMLAMEMIMLSLSNDSKETLKEKMADMSPKIKEYTKMVTKQYIPLNELAGFLSLKHEHINADVLAEIDPRLGAYF